MKIGRFIRDLYLKLLVACYLGVISSFLLVFSVTLLPTLNAMDSEQYIGLQIVDFHCVKMKIPESERG